MRSRTPTNQVVLEGFGGFEDVNSEEDIIEHSGHCYLKTKTESYKKHFMILQGNELRFFRKQGDSDHKVMHCLAGTYLKEITMDEISCDNKSNAPSNGPRSKGGRSQPGSRGTSIEENKHGKTYFPIKLVIPPNKSRLVFFTKAQDQSQWINRIQEAMGYSNVFNFYTLDKTLGKGQFGLVKLAVHK